MCLVRLRKNVPQVLYTLGLFWPTTTFSTLLPNHRAISCHFPGWFGGVWYVFSLFCPRAFFLETRASSLKMSGADASIQGMIKKVL